jgi:hypothetical protein
MKKKLLLAIAAIGLLAAPFAVASGLENGIKRACNATELKQVCAINPR